jgi:hypothetical protein
VFKKYRMNEHDILKTGPPSVLREWVRRLLPFFYTRMDADPVSEMLYLLFICEFLFLEH